MTVMWNPFRTLLTLGRASPRIDWNDDSAWVGQHQSRYLIATKYVMSGAVLDLGCGMGDGSVLLMQKGAKDVHSLDVSTRAVKSAIRKARLAGVLINAVRGDGHKLVFRNRSLTLVVAFETVEHVEHPEALISEVSRVLKANGRLLLSTPNRLTTPSDIRHRNPYHKHEFTPTELLSLLKPRFKQVRVYGQFLRREYLHARQVPPNIRGLARGYRVKELPWVALRLLPPFLRERISRVIYSVPFYPSAGDYYFSTEKAESASVLVADCRK